jgi:hypothetical protein
LKAYVVTIEDAKLTLSNVPLGAAGGGQTFVMPAPKEGAPPPSWVAAAPTAESKAAPRPQMMMVTQANNGAPLTLTELVTAKGAVKAADFPQGTPVMVTYREADGKKWLQTIERVAAK